uniref:AB hydrolase-1 domain-containing protein n=1 Tax=Glycine max TaxID=3847 RepID=A0A0R0F173_SOYBN
MERIFGTVLAVLFIGFVAWGYQAIQPPASKICGSPNGSTITAPRIKLRDGRNLAYKEHGVPKDVAKHKIIFVHGFDACRHDAYVSKTLSPDVAEKLGVYIVSFDRPGYGESDPDPIQTLKSLALDIEELADKLGLGPNSTLASAVLIAPVLNYWWAGLPANLTTEVFYQQKLQDQWTVCVAHYIPWLTYCWNTQRWFPASSLIADSIDLLSLQDKELLPKRSDRKNHVVCSVHIWQGDEDLIVPAKVQRYIAQKLPWIQYHELQGADHLFPHVDGMSDTIIMSLLSGN